MLFFLELHQFFFMFFKTLIRWRNLVLEFSLKVIWIGWMFRGNGKHLILNGSLWKLYQFIVVLLLELNQFFFLFFKTLIIWINISLGFSLKVIFRIWMFRVDGKHFILNGWWSKISQFIMVYFLEFYQFLFLFFKTLIRWRNINLEFSESNHFILDVLWWENAWFLF